MSLHRERTHPEFVEGCFGCKALTVDLNPGEANSRLTMSSKKWEKVLRLLPWKKKNLKKKNLKLCI